MMDDEEIEVNAVVEEEEVISEGQVDALKGDKGDTGPQGIQGEPGYTPIKGVDYFTEEDIDDILSDVNADIADLQTNKADKTEIPDVSSFITKDVNNLTNYTLKTATGSLIDLEINNTTYVITLSLKNVDGTVISTDTIDLPLESVVVSGRYDNATKKVILTLENGSEVDFSVADLVAGLQTEITSSNKLASDLVDDTNSGNKFTNASEKTAWNAKYDKPSGGIPKTDLASDVQTSLGKADTALQEHQSLADYVKNTDYATSSKGGVFKPDVYFSTAMENGKLYCQSLNYAQYERKASTSFISKGTLKNVITGKQLINQTTLDDSQAEQDAEIEELNENNFKFDTATGESLTLSNTARYPFKEFNVSGNSVQNGDPTPETPVPVENVSGEVEVKVENKNLFNKDIDIINGYINSYNRYLINSSTNCFLVPCKSNTTYTISKISSTRFRIGYITEEPATNIIVQGVLTDHTGTILTITTGENALYLIGYIYDSSADTLTLQQIIDSLQIEEGSATSYEPHEEQTATLHLPEGMEMCKIPDTDYKDTFKEQNNNWIIPNKIIKIASYNGETITTPYISSTGGLDTGATVYYVGSEDYTITDPTLISDLNNLKDLYSYKGTTHISNNSEPSLIFEIEYAKDSYLPNALTALTDKIYAYVQDSIDESINQAIGGSY